MSAGHHVPNDLRPQCARLLRRLPRCAECPLPPRRRPDMHSDTANCDPSANAHKRRRSRRSSAMRRQHNVCADVPRQEPVPDAMPAADVRVDLHWSHEHLPEPRHRSEQGLQLPPKGKVLLTHRLLQDVSEYSGEWCTDRYIREWCTDRPSMILKIAFKKEKLVLLYTTRVFSSSCQSAFVFLREGVPSSVRSFSNIIPLSRPIGQTTQYPFLKNCQN